MYILSSCFIKFLYFTFPSKPSIVWSNYSVEFFDFSHWDFFSGISNQKIDVTIGEKRMTSSIKFTQVLT